MIYRFTDKSLEKRLWEFSGEMIQAQWKKGDPGKTAHELTYQGVRAEYGFLDILGEPFDWSIKDGGDGGIDFTYCGYTHQMKYNNYRPPAGELYFRNSQPFVAQVAILSVPLVFGVLGDIEYVGFSTLETFNRYCNPKDWGGRAKPVKSLHSRYLRDMQDWLDFVYWGK